MFYKMDTSVAHHGHHEAVGPACLDPLGVSTSGRVLSFIQLSQWYMLCNIRLRRGLEQEQQASTQPGPLGASPAQ